MFISLLIKYKIFKFWVFREKEIKRIIVHLEDKGMSIYVASLSN